MKAALFAESELPSGTLKAAKVGKRDVVVVHTPDGSLYALNDRCPHRGAPFSRGVLQRVLVGDTIDEHELSDDVALVCPWHGFEFDPATGCALADPERLRVRTYDVSVEDGMIVIEAGASDAEASAG